MSNGDTLRETVPFVRTPDQPCGCSSGLRATGELVGPRPRLELHPVTVKLGLGAIHGRMELLAADFACHEIFVSCIDDADERFCRLSYVARSIRIASFGNGCAPTGGHTSGPPRADKTGNGGFRLGNHLGGARQRAGVAGTLVAATAAITAAAKPGQGTDTNS